MVRLTMTSTLFPYTTLFRSLHGMVDFQDTMGVFVCHQQTAGHTLENALVEILQGFNERDRKSTRLNSSHMSISYAVFCLKKKKLLTLLDIFTLTLFLARLSFIVNSGLSS